MTKDKKALYKKIMDDISVKVKKRLNEEFGPDNGMSEIENDVESVMDEFNKIIQNKLCVKYGLGDFTSTLDNLYYEMRDALVDWVESEGV